MQPRPKQITLGCPPGHLEVTFAASGCPPWAPTFPGIPNRSFPKVRSKPNGDSYNTWRSYMDVSQFGGIIRVDMIRMDVIRMDIIRMDIIQFGDHKQVLSKFWGTDMEIRITHHEVMRTSGGGAKQGVVFCMPLIWDYSKWHVVCSSNCGCVAMSGREWKCVRPPRNQAYTPENNIGSGKQGDSTS